MKLGSILLAGSLLTVTGMAMAGEPIDLVFDPATTHQTWEGRGGTLPMERGTPFNVWVKNPTAECHHRDMAPADMYFGRADAILERRRCRSVFPSIHP